MVAAVAAPWVGVLWLTALPLRLLQVAFADRLIELGADAHRYGRWFGELSWAIGLAFLLALYGRAVYARACGERYAAGRTPGWRALAAPLGPTFSYFYVALVLELLLILLAVTVVAVPVVVTLSGLAAASLPFYGRPGLFAPLRTVLAAGRRGLTLSGSILLFSIAWLVAALNLFLFVQLALLLADGAFGASLAPWHAALGLEGRAFLLLVAVGAWLLVEPYWLAFLVVYVRRLHGRSRGEDLRRAWAALQAAG
ncbi:MAG: hypothetical protein ACRD2T_07890 [Thermoanaerobaculia bacterium]